MLVYQRVARAAGAAGALAARSELLAASAAAAVAAPMGVGKEGAELEAAPPRQAIPLELGGMLLSLSNLKGFEHATH